MMLVMLARHGNTFEAHETPVWVGARTDLPLTAKGRAQAAAIGSALQFSGFAPRRILTGPLKRTRETAAIAAAACAPGVEIEIDDRLREIDYGRWEAKSSEEIRAAGDAAALEAWDKEGAWPADAGWPLSLDEYLQRLQDLMADVWGSGRDPALIVSSNGIFKLLAQALSKEAFSGVKTGHLCLLERNFPEKAEIRLWNVKPDALSL